MLSFLRNGNDRVRMVDDDDDDDDDDGRVVAEVCW